MTKKTLRMRGRNQWFVKGDIDWTRLQDQIVAFLCRFSLVHYTMCYFCLNKSQIDMQYLSMESCTQLQLCNPTIHIYGWHIQSNTCTFTLLKGDTHQHIHTLGKQQYVCVGCLHYRPNLRPFLCSKEGKHWLTVPFQC